MNFAVGDDFESKRDTMLPDLTSRFDDLNRALLESGTKFFTGTDPIACDFTAYHHLDLSRLLDPNLLPNYGRLNEFVIDIEGIDSISKYLDSRPELIDVKIGPKLVINGEAQATGTEKI